MSDDSNVDLRFIGQQLQQLNRRMSSMEDNMTVLTAIVMRMDGTLSGMINEIRAIHSQHGRLANRVKTLEDTREQS